MHIRSIKALLFIALALALLALALPALAEGDGETIYRAMLIGNENYKDGAIKGCITDVNRMSNTLQAANEAGGRYQQPATRTNLKAAEVKALITDMLGWGVDGDDVTLIYYAGLATTTDEGVSSLTGVDGSELKLTELRTALNQLPGTKIVVLDCRYSESAAQRSKLTGTQLLQKFNQSVVDVFKSSPVEQKYQALTSATMLKSVEAANAHFGAPAGLFTYYLTEGCGYDYLKEQPAELMADANLNGAVSMKEARDYVESKIDTLAGLLGAKLTSNAMVYPEDGAYPLFSKRATAEILSITLDQPTLSIAAGKTAKLSAAIQPINARQRSVTWVSSDLGVVTVDSEGLVTGVRPGEAFVTAMAANGMSTQCKVLIRDVVFANSVSLSATKLVVAAGQEQALTLSLTPANSNELINWKSSDVSVATVTQEGVVSPLRNGNTVITATTESLKEVSCVIQVVDAGSVVTDIKVDADKLSIYEGEARLLSAQIKPSRATDPMVVWSSDNEQVAQVESNGLVAGVGHGEAVITATASSGISAKVNVSVKGATIEFKNKSVTVKKGKKFKLQWTTQPRGAMIDISWESSDPEVATVTQNGSVETLKNGQTAITATLSNGMKEVCRVSVASVPAKGIKINKTKLTMEVGAQAQLSAKVAPGNASIKTATWRSGNEKIALIDETGQITATGVGKTTITARTHNGKAAKCVLTVQPAKVTSIVLNTAEESFMLGVDEPFQLTAEIEPVSSVGNRALQWKSSDTKVATVDQTGLITPKGEGTATIRASSGKVKADCKVTVSANRTLRKKATVGKGRKLYVSLRQVAYDGDQLVVQMHFVNRSKKAVYIPTAGTLTLTLSTGEQYNLRDLTPNKNKPLPAGKSTVLTFKMSVADDENLRDLDLRKAKVEIVAEESPAAADTPVPEDLTDTED